MFHFTYFLSFLCPQFFFVPLFEGTSSKVTSITKAKSDLNDKSKKGDQKNKNRKFMSSYDFGSNSFFLGKIRNKKPINLSYFLSFSNKVALGNSVGLKLRNSNFL